MVMILGLISENRRVKGRRSIKPRNFRTGGIILFVMRMSTLPKDHGKYFDER